MARALEDRVEAQITSLPQIEGYEIWVDAALTDIEWVNCTDSCDVLHPTPQTSFSVLIQAHDVVGQRLFHKRVLVPFAGAVAALSDSDTGLAEWVAEVWTDIRFAVITTSSQEDDLTAPSDSEDTGGASSL